MSEANSSPAATVVIGCKLPNGIILEVGKPGEENYQRVQLNGANRSQIAGGAGFTTISADFWAAWHDQPHVAKPKRKNRTLSFMRQGLIWAAPNVEEANAQAMDRIAQRTGFERLDPKKAPKGVEIDGEHMKRSTESLMSLRV